MAEVNLRRLPKVAELAAPYPNRNTRHFIIENRLSYAVASLPSSKVALIEELWVDELHRGTGRGTHMLAALERRLKKEGATHVHLQVGSFFGRARPDRVLARWYRQRGYLPLRGHNGWFVSKTL